MNPMNGQEIADSMGISRQAVSFAIRKSMNKLYYEVKAQGLADEPFDIILTLATILEVNKGSVKDMKEFIDMFSKEIQSELKRDASELYYVKDE